MAPAHHRQSPNFDSRPGGSTLDLIVVHAISLPPGCFGGSYVEDLFLNRLDASAHEYFAGLRDLKVSSHFYVDRAGALTQFVSIHDRAWHAGESSWHGRAACNDFSIGIELEGCDEQAFEEPQYATAARLIALLRHVNVRARKLESQTHAELRSLTMLL
ncbi:MAG: 1,6-anhydro-N-acetylmuramyl-L-alanine amidase AmpD [Pseudomonadota bacterium]